MELLSVVAAGAAAWIFGAIWYGLVATPWMAAVGLTKDTINRQNYTAYIGSFVCCLIVAGMMRHVLVTSNVFEAGKGALTGLGLGLFIAVPWIATNYMFAERRFTLTLIDGVYAAVGCTIMGTILTVI